MRYKLPELQECTSESNYEYSDSLHKQTLKLLSSFNENIQFEKIG